MTVEFESEPSITAFPRDQHTAKKALGVTNTTLRSFRYSLEKPAAKKIAVKFTKYFASQST